MQIALVRIRTREDESTSYDDKYYAQSATLKIINFFKYFEI